MRAPGVGRSTSFRDLWVLARLAIMLVRLHGRSNIVELVHILHEYGEVLVVMLCDPALPRVVELMDRGLEGVRHGGVPYVGDLACGLQVSGHRRRHEVLYAVVLFLAFSYLLLVLLLRRIWASSRRYGLLALDNL